MSEPKNIAVPVKLDAFIFNHAVCNGGVDGAKIAPIAQPNYTFLRLDDELIQHDILDHVDLHNAAPPERNPRYTDLGRQSTRSKRIGVYLHWILPRFYRSGIAATPSVKKTDEHRAKKGFEKLSEGGENRDPSAPTFPSLPNRWLVIRKLDPEASTTLPKGSTIDPIVAWIIESDRITKIDDIEPGTDLQVDVSPFISGAADDATSISVQGQAETFIGKRFDQPQTWAETTADRASLTVASSSNHLFADYQPHCSNVFSMVDNFNCTLPGGQPGVLSAAVASYFVIGWHSSTSDGPFGVMESTTRLERLNALSVILNNMDAQGPAGQWLSSPNPTGVLCHGSMYDVSWNIDSLPATVPADKCSSALHEQMPLAVGSSPIDSLLAYLDAHHDNALEQDVHLLAPLLRAQDDGVQALQATTDEMQNWNFARSNGGQFWYFRDDSDEPTPPNTTEAAAMTALNNMQRLADATQRQLDQHRWNLFAKWWTYISGNKQQDAAVKQCVRDISALTTFAAKVSGAVTKLSTNTKVFATMPKHGVMPEYYQQRDPTALLWGVQSGWPDDYLDKLMARLDTETVQPTPAPSPLPPAFCVDRLPSDLQSIASSLMQEFLYLHSGNAPSDPPKDVYFPLYHDRGKHPKDLSANRDQWNNTQPWFPLFVEWEAEYFHIPFDKWALTDKNTRLSVQRWRLGIKDGCDLQSLNISDTRTVSGRVLILPQPNFDLQAQIARLFSSVPAKVIDAILPDPKDQQRVKDDAYQLPFLSAPLDGFSDHLVTLARGTHIKPTVRVPSQALQALNDAAVGPFSGQVGDQDILALIGDRSDITPYDKLVLFKKEDPFAFKPVAHGQFRFTKLNVIDKFGQAIHATDPRYIAHPNGSIGTPVYPCISENYEPQLLTNGPNAGQPNVIETPAKPGWCEFLQVPPQINQPARLNAAFVKLDPSATASPYWIPTTEWEDPIWGWIVLNYVDYGMQVFFPDGSFYREIRLASPTAPTKTTKSAKFLPFGPPARTGKTEQLDRLIELLTSSEQTYLLNFLKMASKSLQSIASAPSTYSTYMNSLVGRPLALVNIGYSIELGTDSMKDQSAYEQPDSLKHMPMGLLPGDGDEQYQFEVKLGDQDRAFDGLVGYFNTLEKPQDGNELDLADIYTYYGFPDKEPPLTQGPLKRITSGVYPRFSAFWLDPQNYSSMLNPEDAASAYIKDWNSQLQVFGAFVDPFVPVTVYTSFLPIQKLQLPSWTWETAMKKMTAFFHMGPIVVTNDVNPYDKTHKLKKSYDWTPGDDPTVDDSAVGMPALAVADWRWLQPYTDPDDQTQEYMALKLGKVDSAPKFEKTPYTAIEGFLQLKAPVIRPDS